MKTIKEKADELVEQYVLLLSKSYQYPKKVTCIKCAILSVKHTLSVLETISLRWQTQLAINEQTDLLKELESRV